MAEGTSFGPFIIAPIVLLGASDVDIELKKVAKSVIDRIVHLRDSL